jgi:hypothetical protein
MTHLREELALEPEFDRISGKLDAARLLDERAPRN